MEGFTTYFLFCHNDENENAQLFIASPTNRPILCVTFRYMIELEGFNSYLN